MKQLKNNLEVPIFQLLGGSIQLLPDVLRDTCQFGIKAQCKIEILRSDLSFQVMAVTPFVPAFS